MRHPLSLEGLIAWLEKQPAETVYDYWTNDCLLCRYMRAVGFDVYTMGTEAWVDPAMRAHDLPSVLNAVSVGNWPHRLDDNPDWTYGAALARARAAADAMTGER